MMPGGADGETQETLAGLRDGLRSARFWGELLSDSDRQTLLLDIARISLLIAGDLNDGGKTWYDGDVPTAGHSKKPAVPCPLERLAFLQATWPRMEAALYQIEAAPPHVLQNEVRLVETVRAHRVRPKAVLSALRSGGEFVPVPAGAGIALANRLGGKLPRRVYESTTTPCFDTPTNRAAKAVLVRFVRDLKMISHRAAECGLPRAAREAHRLLGRVRRRLLAFPWLDMPLPRAGLNGDTLRVALLPLSLRHSAPHRLIHDTFRQYLDGFALDWNQPLFSLPAQKTWLIYEIWCAFQVVDVLRGFQFRARHGGESGGSEWIAHGPAGLACRLETDRASRLVMENAATKQTITLTYNRFFPRGAETESGNGWHSRGRALRPDMTLEWEGRLLVLDAKFKTYAESGWEGSDIEQMHGYRDAIARGEQRNAVQAAWLLYTGRRDDDGTRRPIIAYPGTSTGAPLGNGEVGAICLRPNASEPCAPLVMLLTRFLKKSSLDFLPPPSPPSSERERGVW